jgi:hypothetical protein
MKIISKVFYVLFVMLISLSACNDSKNKTKISTANDTSQNPTSTEIEQTSDYISLHKNLSYDKSSVIEIKYACFDIKKHEEKISCLYEKYNYESALCGKLNKLLSDKGIDKILKNDFYSPHGGTKQLIRYLCLDEQLREYSEVRYLLSHPAYFEIDIDFHYSPLEVVYLAETDMYCVQTMKRLYELESLGRSDIAWDIREKWLNHYFAQMDMPWDEMASLSPERFFTEFEKVKQLYNSEKDKKYLRQWVDNAEIILFEKAEKGNIEGYAGHTKEQHLATLRQWVKHMRQEL